MSKVTQEQLTAKIAKEDYLRGGDTMTICLLTLHSGFVIVGQSACIDPANYDEDTGCKLAFDDAVNKLWELEGYHVKETVYAAQAAEEA